MVTIDSIGQSSDCCLCLGADTQTAGRLGDSTQIDRPCRGIVKGRCVSIEHTTRRFSGCQSSGADSEFGKFALTINRRSLLFFSRVRPLNIA